MKQLYVWNSISPASVQFVRSHAASPDHALVWWVDGQVDPVALKTCASEANEIIAEPTIADEVAALLSTPVRLLDNPVAIAPAPARGPVLLIPENDTQVIMFKGLFERLDRFEVMPLYRSEVEGADVTLDGMGIPYSVWSPGSVSRLQPSVVVMAVDWGPKYWDIIDECRQHGVPTMCLQEGCLDFGPSMRRMEFVDYPIIQGPRTIRYVRQDSFFLAGNPRFDSIRPLPRATSPTVLVNCNFTYQVFEERRASWIDDVVSVCSAGKVDFFVSQHPRDTGELTGLPVRRSSPAVVHEHIADSTIVISRFSTIIYEALLMGRQAIYYNPHGEKMGLFNEDDTGGIFKAFDRAGLKRALASALARAEPIGGGADARRFLDWHCGSQDHCAADRCAAAIRAVAGTGAHRWKSTRHSGNGAQRGGAQRLVQWLRHTSRRLLSASFEP